TTTTPFFHEFKKQASFFLKEKIKTARLALTDVTPAELLTEEALTGNMASPDTRTMGLISRAAFEVDDYWRIVGILHKRFQRFDGSNWRVSYKALILLEHLLTHGPESVAEEFQSDRDVIEEMESFQFIDEKGFNWGLTLRKKSERVLKLLERGTLLKEERDRARKLTRGIRGFGSFIKRSSPKDESFKESSFRTYGSFCQRLSPETQEDCDSGLHKQTETTWISASESLNPDHNREIRSGFNENVTTAQQIFVCEPHDLSPLLGYEKDVQRTGNVGEDHDHPFNDHGHQISTSLLCS
ncbi:hypothetical protein GIB67_040472, partial [Kingdonia uniflora]